MACETSRLPRPRSLGLFFAMKLRTRGVGMTQHVRTSYRNHRRTTWGLAIAVVVSIAAVLVPLATGAGAPPKYYTLAASPTTACSVPATRTFTLKLKNQTRNQNLGSANIIAPSGISLIDGSGQLVGTTGSITVNVPDSFDSTPNTIRLRNLVLPTTGSEATITVQASVSAPGGTWVSTVKQSNAFSDSGPGNLFALLPGTTDPSTTISECHYAFLGGPGNATRNVAQIFKVQLQTSTGAKVDGSGDLTLSAYQGINSNTQLAPNPFTGLTSTAANGEWNFNVVGTVSGENYSLKAGTNRSAYFQIADCVPTDGTCNVGFVPNGDGSGGAAFNGSGLSSSGIALSFESIPETGAAICSASPAAGGWGWKQLEFPVQPDGTKNFDGITLSTFSYNTSNGFMKVKFYFRLDLFVQTSASQTNDIQICAGAKHSNSPNTTDRAWMGRNSTLAKWDSATNLYWGVVDRIPNCNKLPDFDKNGILDPALCAWGTETVDGVDYRTGTVVFPVDLDLKGVG